MADVGDGGGLGEQYHDNYERKPSPIPAMSDCNSQKSLNKITPSKDAYWFAHGGVSEMSVSVPSDDTDGKESVLQKEREERVRIFKEQQEEERRKRQQELEQSFKVAKKYREQQEAERRKKIEDARVREDERRLQVEERKRQIWEAEQERKEAILRRNLEREARIEARRNAYRNSMSFAFGSSTPRTFDLDLAALGAGRGPAQGSVLMSAISGRRSEEREFGAKRATSACSLDRKFEIDSMFDDSSDISRDCSREPSLEPVPCRVNIAKQIAIEHMKSDQTKACLTMLDDDDTSQSCGEYYFHYSTIPGWLRGSGALVEGEDLMSRSMVSLSSVSRGRRKTDLVPTIPRDRSITPVLISRVMKDNSQSPSRPQSSMSRTSEISTASSQASGVILRPKSTPRRPRPVSIAGTTLSGTSAAAPSTISKRPERPTRPMEKLGAESKNTRARSAEPDQRMEENPRCIPKKPIPPPKTSEIVAKAKSRPVPVKDNLRKSVTSAEPPKKSSALNSHIKNLLPAEHEKKNLPSPEHEKKNLPSPEHEKKNLPSPEHEKKNLPSPEHEKKNLPSPEYEKKNLASQEHGKKNLPSPEYEKMNLPSPDHEIKNSHLPEIEILSSSECEIKNLLPLESEVKNFVPSECEVKNSPLSKSEVKNVLPSESQVVSETVSPVLIDKGKDVNKTLAVPSLMNNQPTGSGDHEPLLLEYNEKETDLYAESTPSKPRITSEEEARAALAEKRRLAREQAEREAELERQRQEELRKQEEEQRRQEELEQKRLEEEQIHLAELHRKLEEEKLRKAIEEQQQREKEERERKEEEARQKAEKEEQERKSREEAERQRLELEERLRKEEEERAERKRRVEQIMSRTRAKTNQASSQQNSQNTSKATTPAEENQAVLPCDSSSLLNSTTSGVGAIEQLELENTVTTQDSSLANTCTDVSVTAYESNVSNNADSATNFQTEGVQPKSAKSVGNYIEQLQNIEQDGVVENGHFKGSAEFPFEKTVTHGVNHGLNRTLECIDISLVAQTNGYNSHEEMSCTTSPEEKSETSDALGMVSEEMIQPCLATQNDQSEFDQLIDLGQVEQSSNSHLDNYLLNSDDLNSNIISPGRPFIAFEDNISQKQDSSVTDLLS